MFVSICAVSHRKEPTNPALARQMMACRSVAVCGRELWCSTSSAAELLLDLLHDAMMHDMCMHSIPGVGRVPWFWLLLSPAVYVPPGYFGLFYAPPEFLFVFMSPGSPLCPLYRVGLEIPGKKSFTTAVYMYYSCTLQL